MKNVDSIIDLVRELIKAENERKKIIAEPILSKNFIAIIRANGEEQNREELLKTLELEKYAQWAMRQTMDHQEGIKSFMEKRKPVFRGE